MMNNFIAVIVKGNKKRSEYEDCVKLFFTVVKGH